MTALTSILMGLGALVILLVITYLLDRWRLRKELALASQIVQTAVGPNEFNDDYVGQVCYYLLLSI